MTPVDPTLNSLITGVKKAWHISLFGESKADKLQILTNYVQNKIEKLGKTNNLEEQTQEFKSIATQIKTKNFLIPKGLAAVAKSRFSRQIELMEGLQKNLNKPIQDHIKENILKDLSYLKTASGSDSLDIGKVSECLSSIITSKNFLESSTKISIFTSYQKDSLNELHLKITLIQTSIENLLKAAQKQRKKEDISLLSQSITNCSSLLKDIRAEIDKKTQQPYRQRRRPETRQSTAAPLPPEAPESAAPKQTPQKPRTAKKYKEDYSWESSSAQPSASIPRRDPESRSSQKTAPQRKTSEAPRPQPSPSSPKSIEPTIRLALGLSPDATVKDVKKARKAALLQNHPDKIKKNFAIEKKIVITERQTLESQLNNEEKTELKKRIDDGNTFIQGLLALPLES